MALTQVKTTGLADDAVTGAKIADDTVAEANMANDAISLTELKAGTDGQIITYDASGNPTAVGPGTDGQVLTSTGAGSPPAFETLPTSGPTLTGSTNNTVVTVTGSNAIAGEATFTYNGSDTLKVAPAGASPAAFIGESDRTTADQQLAEFSGHWDGTSVARMLFHVGADTTNKDEGRITFQTAAPGGTLTERLRIDEDGYITQPSKRSAAFCVRAHAGQTWSAGDIVKLETTGNTYKTFDPGSNYDSSTGKYTAPVAGIYYFSAQLMTTGHSDNDNIQDLLELQSNHGLISYCTDRRTYFDTGLDANGYYVSNVNGTANLAAGDTVWFKVSKAVGTTNDSYCYFTGWMIG